MIDPKTGEKRRAIMRTFKMERISSCDFGAQEGATMAIMKRRDPKPGEAASVDPSDEGKEKADATKAAGATGISKETGMSEGKKAATETPAVSTEDHDKMTKRAERAEAVVALPGAQREYFNKLEPAAQNEFLVLGPEQRDNEIAEAEAKDEIVYKSDGGEIFKASDDKRLVTMAKQADEDRRARVKAEKKAEQADLAKRAESELAHTPGTIEQRSAMLKAVDGIENEEDREAATKALKAGDEALSKSFETRGDRSTPSEDDDADTVLTEIAKKLKEDDSTLTDAQAYSKAIETPEGSQALQAARAAERN